MDRNNPRVSELYTGLHPSVLIALQSVVEAGKSQNCQISVCGELAGTPAGAILLMAMGYDMLSMNAANLPRVKSVIRSISFDFAKDLLDTVMTMDNGQIIASEIELALSRLGQGRVFGPVSTEPQA